MLQGNEGGLPQRVDEYRAFMRFQSWEYDVLPWECDMGLSIYRYPDSIDILVGGLEPWNFMTFQKLLGNGKIIPTDELTPSFFRGVGQPPTRLLLINHH